ncbi:MAG: histidine phosphatase family protein [Actinomycetota bacterium]|nr:histidine phosphatase family protein [Actinomycetota bacterium]
MDAGGILARTITLVRHAETVSNISGTWQGQTDSPLSDRGRLQIERLRDRMDGHGAALLVMSDLGRTRTTGEAIGIGEPLAAWREFDLGAWDGMRPADIRDRYPEVDRVRFGSGDFQPDGGERFSDFRVRVRGAFDTVAARLDDADHAIVVTHGGVIQTIVGSLVGAADQSMILVPSNASLTTVLLDGDGVQVSVFNDDLHLDGGVVRPPGTRLRLVRHAQTEANREHRWFGRGETSLTDEGYRQAAALGRAMGPLDAIVSSPSSRAIDTATAVATRQGLGITIVDDLAEFDFGGWEGLTVAEIRSTDPNGFRRIHEEGFDEPRGRTGETFSGTGGRIALAAADLAAGGTGTIGVFTHGGATRAYVAGMLGIPFADREVLPVPRNTAYSEVISGDGGPRLSSYNVAGHLKT